ncbi:MAG TPA: hypothetical protein VKE98_21280 [Gemmataceae bacterium]|nr:hypothetical protein [Gemmataceae bacterium]
MKRFSFPSAAMFVVLYTVLVFDSSPIAGSFKDKEKKADAKFGKPVRGLVAGAEVVEKKEPNAPLYFEVRFALKNVSDKPITICDYVGSQPVQVRWLGPDGKSLKSTHYRWLIAADIPALDKSNFVTIPAGRIRRIGPRGEDSGIIFQSVPENPQRFGNVLRPGKNRVTVSYVNQDDGKKFGVPKVWTGTVAANEVVITAK